MSNTSVGRRFIFYPAPLFLLRGLGLFRLFRLLTYFPQHFYFYYWASGYLNYSGYSHVRLFRLLVYFSSIPNFITGPQTT
jgi:hypothetical protein